MFLSSMICTHTHTHIYISHVYIYFYMYVCIYVYIYVLILPHTYTHSSTNTTCRFHTHSYLVEQLLVGNLGFLVRFISFPQEGNLINQESPNACIHTCQKAIRNQEPPLHTYIYRHAYARESDPKNTFLGIFFTTCIFQPLYQKEKRNYHHVFSASD